MCCYEGDDSDSFESFWKDNIENLELRTKKIGCTGFGVAEAELNFQQKLYAYNYKDIMQLCGAAPYSIIEWFYYFKILYSNKPRMMDHSYDTFYFALLQMLISRSKDLNRFDLLSQFVIERENIITEKTIPKYKRIFRKYFLGMVLGYGEKLENIILSLMLFAGIMVFVYMNIDLCGMLENICDRFIAAIYFLFDVVMHGVAFFPCNMFPKIPRKI